MNSPKIINHIKISLEMISLTLVLLGANDAVVSDDGFIHFSPPGAYHHARWMAIEINCINIYLFSNFNNALTHDEVHRELIFQIVKYN